MKFLLLFIIAVSFQIAFSQTSTPTPSTSKLTPEQVEAVKQQNAKAEQINGLINEYRADVAKNDWVAAAAVASRMITLDQNVEFYLALGNAQAHIAKYEDAIASYETVIKGAGNWQVVKSAGFAEKAVVSKALAAEGNCYLKLKKKDEAVNAYSKAAEIDPNPGLAYFNLCAMQYNIGNMDAAVEACGKSIAADPKRADAYFIKGSALYGNGKMDANGKYVLPPGTIEALKKYLELAPNGAHVEDVKAMLEAAK